jgi:hypothetical protein
MWISGDVKVACRGLNFLLQFKAKKEPAFKLKTTFTIGKLTDRPAHHDIVAYRPVAR